jgi:hypothetical protein
VSRPLAIGVQATVIAAGRGGNDGDENNAPQLAAMGRLSAPTAAKREMASWTDE